MIGSRDVTVAIPTYQREEVLISTIEAVLQQGPAELLVVDQSVRHEQATQTALREWDACRAIRLLRLPRPSITRAMNTALHEARGSLVLFLDDDVVPAPGLIEAHARAYGSEDVWAVVGQVLQPGEQPIDVPYVEAPGFGASLEFPFNSIRSARVHSVIACNLSVRRQRALHIGGFDENFVGVAYRFETEFCRRIYTAGGSVLFEPTGSVHHLKFPRGGTRSHGSHLTSLSPAHSVGDYYFALREGPSPAALSYILRRPFRAVRTRFHLARPWWIPIKLMGEIAGFLWAVLLLARGPRFHQPPTA